MRILFITRKYPPSVGGMETYSKEIHRAFKSIGSHVDLHVPPADVLGRPTLRQMASFFLSTCWMLLHRARDYDAILLGDFALASIAPVAKLATFGRTRVVVTMHGNDLYFMRKRTPLAMAYWLLNRCIIGTRTLDAAIANSQAIREEAARYGVLDVTVVPLATVVPPRQVMDAVGRKPRIIFTGRLIHYKGLSWFVREVWPHLSSTLELVVAGQVWDAAEMDCIANQAGIRYLGALSYDDLAPLRAGSIASIMPNIPPDRTEQDEGFGLVALEAPAVGTPTVASRCGGIPDAVADGITGFLVPALDAGAWIRRLDEIATWQPLQRQAFAERARQHVIEHYNWTLVAERTLAVLGPPSSNPATVDSFHQ